MSSLLIWRNFWDSNPGFLGGGVGMAKEKWKELGQKTKQNKTKRHKNKNIVFKIVLQKLVMIKT